MKGSFSPLKNEGFGFHVCKKQKTFLRYEYRSDTAFCDHGPTGPTKRARDRYRLEELQRSKRKRDTRRLISMRTAKRSKVHRTNAMRTSRALPSDGEKVGGEYYGMVHWKLSTSTVWKYNKTPEGNHFFLWKHLVRGASGRAFLTCDSKGAAWYDDTFLKRQTTTA
jgi:hypothetical protein